MSISILKLPIHRVQLRYSIFNLPIEEFLKTELRFVKFIHFTREFRFRALYFPEKPLISTKFTLTSFVYVGAKLLFEWHRNINYISFLFFLRSTSALLSSYELKLVFWSSAKGRYLFRFIESLFKVLWIHVLFCFVYLIMFYQLYFSKRLN